MCVTLYADFSYSVASPDSKFIFLRIHIIGPDDARSM
jgi:hypothetical protein